MKNTHRRGAVRCIIFKEKGSWYGVALEFNLVVDGDTPQEVFGALDEAVRSYFEAARKNKLDVSVLNQKPAAEYERMWKSVDGGAHPGKKPARTTRKVHSSLVLRPALA